MTYSNRLLLIGLLPVVAGVVIFLVYTRWQKKPRPDAWSLVLTSIVLVLGLLPGIWYLDNHYASRGRLVGTLYVLSLACFAWWFGNRLSDRRK